MKLFGLLKGPIKKRNILTPKISLDLFYETIGNRIDNYILGYKQKGYTYLGGKAYFCLDDRGVYIIIDVVLYFYNVDRLIQFNKNAKYLFSFLNREAKREFINELSVDGVYVVEVIE